MNEYDRASRDERAQVEAAYGLMMERLFTCYINLERLRRIIESPKKDEYSEEVKAKAVHQRRKLTEVTANWQNDLGPADKSKIALFNYEMKKHDLSSHNKTVIEDVLRQLGTKI
jgi:hypothetical protein